MTDSELSALVEAFEACTLPMSAWHHREHLLVAIHYARSCPPDRALDSLCTGIQRLNASHGVQQTTHSGYHETLTRFLGQAVCRLLETRRESPLSEQIEAVLDALSDWRAAIRPHYTRARLMSWEARTGWVEPDLERLP